MTRAEAAPRWLTAGTAGLLGAAALFTAAEALLSLAWSISHDTSVFAYEGWLMHAAGAVPYRDIAELNFPGTLVLFQLVGRLAGFEDLGYRVFDLAVLAGIAAFTAAALRPFGRGPRWAAPILVAAFYLGHGPAMSLQREWLLLLPVSAALALLVQEGWGFASRAFLMGLLFGAAATIKPHVLLGYPWLLGCLLWRPAEAAPPRRLAAAAAASAAGLALPLGAMVLYLVLSGAWTPFLELVLRFGPIYSRINGDYQLMPPGTQWPYMLRKSLDFGGYRIWLVPAAIGVLLTWTSREVLPAGRRMLVALLGLWPLFTAAVAIQLRFFDYQFLLPLYPVFLLAALCFHRRAEVGVRKPVLYGAVPIAILLQVAVAGIKVSRETREQLAGRPVPPVKDGRVDRVARFLRERMRPGDRVQPLEFVNGAVHGMLRARAPLATPYIWELFLCVGVSDPHVREMRRRFLDEVRRSPPRFVVEARYRARVGGPDTTPAVAELEEILRRDYAPVGRDRDFIFHERRETAAP